MNPRTPATTAGHHELASLLAGQKKPPIHVRDEIETCLRARFTVRWIASYEEDRSVGTRKAGL